MAPSIAQSAMNEALQQQSAQEQQDQPKQQPQLNGQNEKSEKEKQNEAAPSKAAAQGGVIVPELEDSIESSNEVMKAFNQLPVKQVNKETQKQIQEDSVGTFLRKADEQEKDEQKKVEEDKKRAFDAGMSFGKGNQNEMSLASAESDSDEQSE